MFAVLQPVVRDGDDGHVVQLEMKHHNVNEDPLNLQWWHHIHSFQTIGVYFFFIWLALISEGFIFFVLFLLE